MIVILFSRQSFIEKELKKSDKFDNIYCIDSIEKIFDIDVTNQNVYFLHHFDTDSNIKDTLKIIKENYFNVKLIAIRNNTNNIEGCAVLKQGYKAYVNALANVHIFENILTTVSSGNVWVYPELMQFLISSIPEKENKSTAQLEKLTVKEKEVLQLIAQSLNNKQIAQTLNLAEVTVKKHIGMLFKKLEVKDRLSLALIFKNQA